MRSAVAILLLAAFGLTAPAVASAETVIPADRTVAEITVVGDDVTLNGTSAGSVIVVAGDLTIGPHGKAMHGVTVVGGRVVTAPGGVVDGDVLQLGSQVPALSIWTFAVLLAAALLARCAVVWLLWRMARLLVPWTAAPAVLAAARVRPFRTTAVGALLVAGLTAGAILLALTVIGLLLSAALAALLLLAAALGVSFVLGRDNERGSERSRTVGIALAFPLIGDALLGLAAIVAAGALFHYLIDERAPRGAVDPVNP
jgi:hypothetical protein